jgi:hypothetical protein
MRVGAVSLVLAVLVMPRVDAYGHIRRARGIDVNVHCELVTIGRGLVRVAVVIKLVLAIIHVIHVVPRGEVWVVLVCAGELEGGVEVIVADDPDEPTVPWDPEAGGAAAWVGVGEELGLRGVGTLEAMEEGKEDGVWGVGVCEEVLEVECSELRG